jgi:hypothetical protein
VRFIEEADPLIGIETSMSGDENLKHAQMRQSGVQNER